MRKNLFLSAALLLIISIIVVSCAPAEVQTEDTSNTIQVYFGNLEAKAIDDTAYTVTGSATFDGSTVKIGDVDDYYWSYKATKNDSLFNQGQTDGFVNCVECASDGSGGTGLGTARTFSKGKWLFELRAYATAADRKAGTQYLFSGTNKSITTNNSDTVLSSNTTISIPVQYSYIAGTGIADFAITTTLTQDKEEAGSDIKTYTVTGVTASIGGKDYELESTDNETWELTTPQEVPSGVQAVGLKVFVDSAEVSQASNASIGNAIILHGLTTEIKGTATITLTGSTIGLTFNPSMPSEQPTEDGFPKPIAVGDIIELGSYPATYTNSSGESVSAGDYAGKPVTWKVLAVDETNNRALVISEYILTDMAYANSTADTYNWTSSEVCIWLNGTFITSYGLSDVPMAAVEHETSYYIESKIPTPGGTCLLSATNRGTEKTTEKVFVLSLDEIKEYYPTNELRIATTLYGVAEEWWTRSYAGHVDDFPAIHRIYTTGEILPDELAAGEESTQNYAYVDFMCAYSYNANIGVRPAFWINF